MRVTFDARALSLSLFLPLLKIPYSNRLLAYAFATRTPIVVNLNDLETEGHKDSIEASLMQ